MSLLEDLYRADDDGNNDLEHVIEQDREHDHDNSDHDSAHSEAEEVAPRRVDPNSEKKAKVVKNPRLTLNPKRLTGPRGIRIIEDVYTDFKFQGKGHEKEDLDLMMKKLEHWAHRLYPKFQFDDCIEKIAVLGKKKEVTVHLRKIRMNLIEDDHNIIQQTDNDDGENNIEEPIMDEFDRLLDQQIALARSTPASIAKSVMLSEKKSTHDSIFINDLDSSLNNVSTPKNTNVVTNKPPTGSETSSGISVEQRERMLQNRIMAEKKRLERLKNQQEAQKVTNENNTETNSIPDESMSIE